MSKGRTPCVVDFLVTHIAHFRLAYMMLFVRKQGTKRTFLPSHPYVYKVRNFEARGKERRTMQDGNACTRLQDKINTILCKRARLIVRGKASRISGIPNKLTLNAEGSPLSSFHLRVSSVSSRASTFLDG